MESIKWVRFRCEGLITAYPVQCCRYRSCYEVILAEASHQTSSSQLNFF